MLWVIFFLTIFINGIFLTKFFFKHAPRLVSIALVFPLGSFFSVSLLYFLTSYLIRNIDLSFFAYTLFLLLFYAVYIKTMPRLLVNINFFLTKEWIFIVLLFLFSWFIFQKSFSYDPIKSEFLISSNVYADFGIHIPYIRSFSLGNNFPADIPVYGNSNLFYHFMTDFYAGVLEHFGLRIDYAINSISAFAFTSLLLIIYSISVLLFANKYVGLLSIILFMNSGGFTLLEFLKQQSSFRSIISSFWHNTIYFSSGPLGGNTIAIYWSLNTFLNQRHLVFGLIFLLIILYLLISAKKL